MKKENGSMCKLLLATVFITTAFPLFCPAATGMISGVVTSGSNPLPDVSVFAVLNETIVAFSITNSNGQYTLEALTPNTYKVRTTAEGYLDNTTGEITVTSGQTVTQNIQLTVEGKISGKVTLVGGTTGISGKLIMAADSSNNGFSAYTNEQGEYTINKLTAGIYKVFAVDTNEYSFSRNDNVTVSAGQTTSNINITAINGIISGTITESNGTTVIPNAIVLCWNSNDQVILSSTTNSNGIYNLKYLDTGTYKVTVSLVGRKIRENSSVSVTNSQTTTLNLSAPGGSISGSVRNSNQVGIANTPVIIRNGEMISTVTTDSNGNYSILRLTAGTYTANVYGRKIEDIIVNNNQNTANQNFIFDPEGSISGRITNISQSPIQGAIVCAVNTDSTTLYALTTTTNANGEYILTHIPAGVYIITVSADSYVSASEEDVSVIQDQAVTGKDFTLGNSGGIISGQVFQSNGQTPITGALVSVFCAGKSVSQKVTDSNGNYSIPFLQAGTYTVTAIATGYTQATLNNVVVTGTQENSGNNFSLLSQ